MTAGASTQTDAGTPAATERTASTRKEQAARSADTSARAGERPCGRPLTISHPAETPESLWRGMHARGVLPLWDRCSPSRRGDDTRRSLPTPCRRGDGLHVPQARIDSAGRRYSQREATQAESRLKQSDCPPCPSGIRRRSMVRVRVPAGWLGMARDRARPFRGTRSSAQRPATERRGTGNGTAIRLSSSVLREG
jgi:hypothetical protein